MNDKIRQLEESSLLLKQRINNDIKSPSPTILPITDGIINIENYVNSDFKILWILKEPNDLEKKDDILSGGNWDLCDTINKFSWIEQSSRKGGRHVFRKLSYCSYYILNRHEYGEKINKMNEDMWNAFKSTAFINVKKLPGGSNVKDSVIKAAYKKNKEILHDQIDVFNPNIIIGCNTLGHFSKYFKFNRQDKKHFQNFNRWFSAWKGYYPQKDRLYIDTCHPLKWGMTDHLFLHSVMACFDDWILNYRDK